MDRRVIDFETEILKCLKVRKYNLTKRQISELDNLIKVIYDNGKDKIVLGGDEK